MYFCELIIIKKKKTPINSYENIGVDRYLIKLDTNKRFSSFTDFYQIKVGRRSRESRGNPARCHAARKRGLQPTKSLQKCKNKKSGNHCKQFATVCVLG